MLHLKKVNFASIDLSHDNLFRKIQKQVESYSALPKLSNNGNKPSSNFSARAQSLPVSENEEKSSAKNFAVYHSQSRNNGNSLTGDDFQGNLCCV